MSQEDQTLLGELESDAEPSHFVSNGSHRVRFHEPDAVPCSSEMELESGPLLPEDGTVLFHDTDELPASPGALTSPQVNTIELI
eukprot:8744158-Pyramimonas_sp.AAC.1